MLAYTGGQTVGEGTYRSIDMDGRMATACAVPSAAGTSGYAGMSSIVMLLSGPFTGFLYAMLMPVIGIATVAALSARMVLETLYYLAVKSVSCGWRPQNAYLWGRKKSTGAARK